MKTAWELSIRLGEIFKELDELNSKRSSCIDKNIIDGKIDVLEEEMFEIKDKLKNIEVI